MAINFISRINSSFLKIIWLFLLDRSIDWKAFFLSSRSLQWFYYSTLSFALGMLLIFLLQTKISFFFFLFFMRCLDDIKKKNKILGMTDGSPKVLLSLVTSHKTISSSVMLETNKHCISKIVWKHWKHLFEYKIVQIKIIQKVMSNY